MKVGDPRRTPAAAWPAVIAALLLGGFAVVLGQHAAAELGWIGADSWLRTAFASLDDAQPSTWVLIAGIAAALIGLWFLIAAFLPARRSHLPADGTGDLWVSPRVVEALASDAAGRAPGVLHAHSELRRRRLKVKALLAPGHEAAVADIMEAVGDRLNGLAELEVAVQAKEASR
jgi:hypothetical protein